MDPEVPQPKLPLARRLSAMSRSWRGGGPGSSTPLTTATPASRSSRWVTGGMSIG